jgi:hypothetical protein
LTATNPEDSAISLIQDDALYRVQRAIGLIPPSGLGVARRAVLYTLITWLPIAVWAWLHGHAMAGSLDEPLFRHFGVNVRCLLAIPLLIVADATAHGVSLRLIPQFVRAGIVADDEAFHAVLERARRARSRTLPWVIIAGLVIGWVVLAPSLLQQHDLLWRSMTLPPTISASAGGGISTSPGRSTWLSCWRGSGGCSSSPASCSTCPACRSRSFPRIPIAWAAWASCRPCRVPSPWSSSPSPRSFRPDGPTT